MLRSALRILGKTWQLTSIVSIWRINMKNVAPQNQTQRLSLFNKAVPGDLRDLVPRNQKVCTLTSGSLSLPANMEPFAFWGMHVILNCSEHINQTWLGLEHNELVPAGIKIIIEKTKRVYHILQVVVYWTTLSIDVTLLIAIVLLKTGGTTAGSLDSTKSWRTLNGTISRTSANLVKRRSLSTCQ